MAIDNHYIALETTKKYTRTASGKSWKKNPESITYKVISADEYNNKIDPNTIKFFNWDIIGASMRAHYGYTFAGYVATEIVTIGPNKAFRRVETYEILNLRDMIKCAGFREKDIMNRAVTFEKDKDTISFYTKPDESGHSDGCEWSMSKYCWVG